MSSLLTEGEPQSLAWWFDAFSVEGFAYPKTYGSAHKIHYAIGGEAVLLVAFSDITG